MIALEVKTPRSCGAEAPIFTKNTADRPRKGSTMSHTPDGAPAPAPSNPRRRFHFEPPPIDPALRKRRIRIARAVNLIARTKCNCVIAARACGLDGDSKALQDIRDGTHKVHFSETPSRVFEEFIPRHDLAKNDSVSHLPPSRRTLAEMAAELMAVADPLGEDVPRADRARDADRHVSETKAAAPRPPRICASCGDAFEGNRGAKFCGVACRVRHWRAEQ